MPSLFSHCASIHNPTPVAYLSLQGQFLLQVLNFGFIPENISLELLMSLKHKFIKM